MCLVRRALHAALRQGAGAGANVAFYQIWEHRPGIQAIDTMEEILVSPCPCEAIHAQAGFNFDL
jgi:hypothetical protein